MAQPKRHSILVRNRFLLRNTWRYFSDLGTPYAERLMEMRSNVLSNQLNFVLFGTMLILLIITITVQLITHDSIGIGTLRVAILLLVCFINLVLAYFRFHLASKFSLIFLTPIVFLIIPVLIGFVEEEGYTYNPYLLIAISIIPQLLLSSENEKFAYWFSMVYYFIMVVFIDILMMHFQKDNFPIVDRLKTFYPYYKIAQIGVFVFVNLSIYHLRKVSFRFEDRLNDKNHVLDIQNKELKNQREKITMQKNLIEDNSRSTFESIQYARRIQNAVLQPVNFLDEWGIENFILYKPAAVVSGDFYWGCRKDKRIIITAADCTGHGVPGAFMSMLGLAFIEDVFDTSPSLNAGKALDILRDNIINKLRQKGESGEPKDGMDLSLCIIDSKSGTLDFAGAMNPIYLIRDGNLMKIEADKMPIGLFLTPSMPFKDKIVDLRKDDALYLFTDGYTDQFGGPDKRRFMIRPFQDLLVNIQSKPMNIQKEILDKTFENWKSDSDQVDDVLVVGLRI